MFIFLLYGPLLLSLCHSPAYSEVSNCNHGNNSHSTGLLELLEVDFRISSVTSEESAVQRGRDALCRHLISRRRSWGDESNGRRDGVYTTFELIEIKFERKLVKQAADLHMSGLLSANWR